MRPHGFALAVAVVFPLAHGQDRPKKLLPPGDHVRRVKSGGRDRSYRVHVPRGYDGETPAPVVLAFHGGGSNAQQMERYCGLSAKADKGGFVVAYPNGTARPESMTLTWNTGLALMYATRKKIDDVAFTRLLLDDLESCVVVDRRRVFATGISNGAMMCYLLAEKLSDRIAAIAPVAGTMAAPRHPPGRPVPVVHFHGTEDHHAPIGGGIGKRSRVRRRFPSADNTMAAWARINGCPGEPKTTPLPDVANDGMRVTHKAYGPGKNGAAVELYVIDGGGHTWPGAASDLRGLLGPTTRDISANDVMWEFFRQHPMPQQSARSVDAERTVPTTRRDEGEAAAALPPSAIGIPTRDGQKLAADLYLPSRDGKFPTILVQTPYDRRSFRSARVQRDRLFDRGHYAWVIVDWRGYFGSKGAPMAVKPQSKQRGLDGHDAVEWIARQPWSDGKVGAWGASALGKVQFWTAEQKPPHLLCIAPIVAGHGYTYAQHYHGGVLKKAHTERKDTIGFEGYSRLPKAHPTYDLFWRWAERATRFDAIDLPVLMIGGWYDTDTEGVLRTFHALRKDGGARTQEHLRLLMGPWTHNGASRGALKVGALSFPAAERASQREGQAFFDYWLRGTTGHGWDKRPRVRYFQMGENQWIDGDDWPSDGRDERRFYLHSGGRLVSDVSGAEEASDGLQYDPSDPSPTIGGMNLPGRGLFFWGGLLEGATDQRAKVEARSDCLVYTSQPLETVVRLQGTARAVLHVSSDQPDTDVAVRLCDVHPDERSMLLTDGIQRMAFRKSPSRREPMVAGRVYEATVRLVPTSHTFMPGHRVRIVVTAANYPRYDKHASAARNTVHHDAQRPSALVLPAVR